MSPANIRMATLDNTSETIERRNASPALVRDNSDTHLSQAQDFLGREAKDRGDTLKLADRVL